MADSLMGVSITRSQPKRSQQTFAGLERSAVNADVFADQHHRGIAFHLFVHGLLDGFEKGDLGRRGLSSVPFSRPSRTRLCGLRSFLWQRISTAAGLAFRFELFRHAPASVQLRRRASAHFVLFACRQSESGRLAAAGSFATAEIPLRSRPQHTLDFGGVTSAIGRSHLGAILWQSSPVQ